MSACRGTAGDHLLCPFFHRGSVTAVLRGVQYGCIMIITTTRSAAHDTARPNTSPWRAATHNVEWIPSSDVASDCRHLQEVHGNYTRPLHGVFTVIKNTGNHISPLQADPGWFKHVSPMFCNMLPFFFYVTCVNSWFSAFSPFFDRTGCVYPPKVDAYTFSMCSTADLFCHTSLSSFKLNLM